MKKDLLILLILILPAFSQILRPGYFPMHDDLQSLRQYEIDKCFSEGQIPCRWVLDMGYGYGYPLFNFYPPLPYLIGQAYRTVGLSYIDIVKAVGVTGFTLTALGMYLLAKQFWGRSGGLLSSLLYTYAPYHAVDFYVRGAMNEFWAMVLYPWLLLGIYQVLRSKQIRWFYVTIFSTAGLLLSHNPVLMISVPVFALWTFYWLFKTKAKNMFSLVLAVLLGFSLASFFTLPVLFEQKYAHVETLVIGYFNYLGHFLDLRQMFINPNWGYGESIYGPGDTMSFFVGYLHWILPIVAVLFTAFNKKLRENKSLVFLLFLFVTYSLFMAHRRSAPIWELFKPLEYLQFPWRFLTLGAFTTSLLSGAIVRVVNRQMTLVLFTLILLLNANFFHPRIWQSDMTDAKKFSGDKWRLLTTSGIFDYLPIYAPMPPADKAGDDINLISGQGSVQGISKRTNYQEYLLNISSPEAVAELQNFYFPGWQIWVNGIEQVIDPSRDPLLGRIQFDLSEGSSRVVAKFTNTPIRSIGDTLSLMSLAIIALLTAKYMYSWK